MTFDGLVRKLVTRETLVLSVALLGACARGLDPDRSGLDGSGGGTTGVGGSIGSGGSTTTDTTTTTTEEGGGGTTTTTTNPGGGGSTSTTTEMGGGGSTSTTSAGGGGSTSTSTPTDPPTGLYVQYKAADTNAVNAEIKAVFNVVNGGADPVDVNGLSIRYYYTIDAGPETQQFHCDYAFMDCAKVMGSFGTQVGVNADHYLEVKFSGAGTLAAGGQTGEIQARWNKTDFTAFNENNDYSFDPTKLAFTEWMNVTLYSNGALVWGVEP